MATRTHKLINLHSSAVMDASKKNNLLGMIELGEIAVQHAQDEPRIFTKYAVSGGYDLAEFIDKSAVQALIKVTDDKVVVLEGRVTSAEGDIQELQEAIGTGGSVDEKIAAALNALDASKSSASVEEGMGVQVKVDQLDGAITAVTLTGNYDNKYDAKGDAAQALVDAKTYAKNYADGLDDAMDGRVQAVEGKLNGITDTVVNYVDGKIATELTSVFVYKGTCTYANLPASGNKKGDVWNVTDEHDGVPAGTNYAWDGTKWDALAGQIDLTHFAEASAVTALEGRVETAESDIQSLEGLVGEESVADQIADAIDGLDVAVVGGTDYYIKSIKEDNGKITATTGSTSEFDAAGAAATVLGASSDTWDSKKTVYGAAQHADALNNAMDTRVDALEAAIGGGGSVDTKIEAAINALDSSKTGSVTTDKGDTLSVTVEETDGKISSVAVAGNFNQTYDLKGSATAAETSAKAYADGLDAAMDSRMDSAEAKLAGISTTVVAYADNKVATEIAKLDADAVGGEGKYIKSISETDGVITAVAGNTSEFEVAGAAADALADAKDYADGLDSAMDSRVDALEAAIGTGGSVDEKIAAAVNALDVDAVGGTGKYIKTISEADGKIVAVAGDTSEFDAAGAADTAEANAKAYADTLNTAMDSRVTNIANNYVKSVTIASGKASGVTVTTGQDPVFDFSALVIDCGSY